MTDSPDTRTPEAQAARLLGVYEQLAALLQQPEVANRLRNSPTANEWSALQIVGHMAEMIPYWLQHCRVLIEAAGDPPRFGRTLDAPERLAGVERGANSDPDGILHLLNDEVQAAAKAIHQMSPAERGKQGLHLRLGAMTVADVVESFIVAHAEDHVTQVRAALQA